MASEDLLKKAVAAFNALSPEQQAEMMDEQRQSWVRGNIGLSRDERGMTSPMMRALKIVRDTNDKGRQALQAWADSKTHPTPAAPVSPDATGKCGELVTVAWTNKAQLDFLKDDQWKVIPMAMWAKGYQAASDDDIGLCDRSQAVELLAAKKEALRQSQKDGILLIDENYKLKADNAALTARVKEWEKADRLVAAALWEKKVEALEAQLAAAEQALEPFAEYCVDHFDKDFNGNPLPDEQKVGWVYLNYGHFRRARAVMGGKPS